MNQQRMGLTKQYLRYISNGIFGVIGSPKSNIVFINEDKRKLCAVGACENVLVWDIRKGQIEKTLVGDKHEVTVIAGSPDKSHLAVGYQDGDIRIYNIDTEECMTVFSGHKSSVTALNYDHLGVQLVSGSKDTDVIVWDIVNESGLYRLKGHKGQITQAKFLKNREILITSSKDTFLKFWDLCTQHCFKTLIGHTTEVWDFICTKDEKKLVTGCGDNEIRLWALNYLDETNEIDNASPAVKRQKIEKDKGNIDDGEDDDGVNEIEEPAILTCTKISSIIRHGKERVVNLKIDDTGTILACHGTDSMMEVFKLNSSEEVKRRLLKRQKKAKKRIRDTGQDEEIPTEENISDIIGRIGSIKASGKLRGFDLSLDTNEICKFACLLSNNSLDILEMDTSITKPEGSSIYHIVFNGHRSDVRTLAFSSDNTAIVSASAESVRIWNRDSLKCFRQMACDYALCSLFAPGDRHIILGTKTGKIQIFDVASGQLLESIAAHSGAIWSIHMAPDKRGIVSGSADHDVKFWDFELVSDEQTMRKQLSLVHARTLKMSDDVLCVRFSPDHRLIAVSLLDNTVKVFFIDSLKFFLSLYGHKLPVLCMDISSDNSLLVTGSADRNIKLWGLDFGDCHKSIFAHDDSVMCVQFIANTHLFFTAGKDGKVKQWDADSFEHILTFTEHHAEIWCLAISSNGKFFVTGSHDKSLRCWIKTNEPLVLSEEREMEREREQEESAIEQQPVIPGETNTEVGMAGRKTMETVRAAEKIMEALNLYKEEMAKLEQHEHECRVTKKQLPPPPLHPIFMAYNVTTPVKYVLNVIKRVKSSELEESLLVLPFSYVTELLSILHIFLENNWDSELTCRCLLFLLRIHHGQITSSEVFLPAIDKLCSTAPMRVQSLKDVIGFNIAGLQFLKQQKEQKEDVIFFADATGNLKEKKKKHKQKSLITLKT